MKTVYTVIRFHSEDGAYRDTLGDFENEEDAKAIAKMLGYDMGMNPLGQVSNHGVFESLGEAVKVLEARGVKLWKGLK
jgi:hypothetical protein